MKLGILGHGVVGSGVTSILDDLKIEDIEVKHILVKDETEIVNEKMSTDSTNIYNDDEIDTIVECIGGLEPSHTFALNALKSKRNYITSNKKMFATFAKELIDAANDNDVKVFFEASVGGGIPWIENINRVKKIDKIQKIEGIFNGTTNYILTRMSDDEVSFEEALKKARELGYAEFNASDDIDGYDVMYKIMISSIVAYDALINLIDITKYGIGNIDIKDIEYAKVNDGVIKLIGVSELVDNGIVAYVMPKLIKNGNMLSNIKMNDNALTLISNNLGKASFVGQGAGSLPTAHAVVQNILDIKERRDYKLNPQEYEIFNNKHIGKYYLRSTKIDLYKDIKEKEINSNTIITKMINLKELESITSNDESLFVMEVEND